MIKSKTVFKYLVIHISCYLGVTTTNANVFSKEDKFSVCYTVNNGVPNKPERCSVVFDVLNEDENSAVTVYKNQIFRISNHTTCDSDQADTCYIDNETLAFGRSGKVNETEYMYLKEEIGQTYYRNKISKRMQVIELFNPISDSWATCMKSKTYNFCIQSKYSIEKIPKLRNEF